MTAFLPLFTPHIFYPIELLKGRLSDPQLLS
jgi:hypothetical protein